jgi:hypothetical protein
MPRAASGAKLAIAERGPARPWHSLKVRVWCKADSAQQPRLRSHGSLPLVEAFGAIIRQFSTRSRVLEKALDRAQIAGCTQPKSLLFLRATLQPHRFRAARPSDLVGHPRTNPSTSWPPQTISLALTHRARSPQFLQISFEKMVGDDQRFERLASIAAARC